MFGAIWEFLKGKKTIIGGVLNIVAKGLVATGHPEIGTIVDLVSTGVIGVGLAHKAIDAVLDNPAH